VPVARGFAERTPPAVRVVWSRCDDLVVPRRSGRAACGPARRALRHHMFGAFAPMVVRRQGQRPMPWLGLFS